MPKKGGIIDQIKGEIQNFQDERQKKSIARAVQFAKGNRNCLIMMLDIKTDDLVCAWEDHYIAARFLSPLLHQKTRMVKTILLGRQDPKKQAEWIFKFSQFVGEFLYQMAEHSEEKRQYKEATSKGFKGNFTEFIKLKRSVKDKSKIK